MTKERQKLTEPLGIVTAICGYLLLFAALLGAISILSGRGSLWGFGHTVMICENHPGTYGSGHWTAAGFGVAARPGATINVNGTLQACTTHPGVSQRVLYTLTSAPSLLVWAGTLFLIWRLLRAARRTGPFTARVAAIMRRLGWLIIAGSAAAALIQGWAQDQLVNTLLASPPGFYNLITLPFQALLPFSALAGAALLTFARIIRLGTEMDDEIKATV